MKLIITFIQRLPENQQNLPHDHSKALTKPQSPPPYVLWGQSDFGRTKLISKADQKSELLKE